jgi:hypothetical protein
VAACPTCKSVLCDLTAFGMLPRLRRPVLQAIKSTEAAIELYHALLRHEKFREANTVIDTFNLHTLVPAIDGTVIDAQAQQQAAKYLQLPLRSLDEDVIIVHNSLASVAMARECLFASRYVGMDAEWYSSSQLPGASILQVQLRCFGPLQLLDDRFRYVL